MCSSIVEDDSQGRPQLFNVVDFPGLRQLVDKGADVCWRGWGQGCEQFFDWAAIATTSRRPVE
eukprot:2358054-Karenia_brevis.AAC.1